MLEYIVKAFNPFIETIEKKNFYFVGSLNRDYCIKMFVKEESVDFPECKVIISDGVSGNEILTHHFLEKGFIKFNLLKATPVDNDNTCMIDLYFEFPYLKKSPIYTEIEIIEIKSNIINSWNIPPERKEELFNIINLYLNNDYRSVINEISIFGEYIARKIAEKAENKKFMDFRSAIEALTHYDPNKRTKIKYIYMGALLWPLYYIRNDKLHPFHQIKFNKSTAELALTNLSKIVKHLSKLNIKLE